MTPGFGNNALVRSLLREEIVRRSLPLRWWGEFQNALQCCSPVTGNFAIPAGFLTDAATVPRLVWGILSPTDPDILYPSFAHDYLYAVNGVLEGRVLSRKDCDVVLRELMLALGAAPWKARLVYLAVRAGGARAWADAGSYQKLPYRANSG